MFGAAPVGGVFHRLAGGRAQGGDGRHLHDGVIRERLDRGLLLLYKNLFCGNKFLLE